MEFGHIYDSLENIDFTLPPDPDLTVHTLKEKQTGGDLEVYVGASKFGEKTWKGIIYPPRALDKEFLNLYSKQFNAVEFSATFYSIPKMEDIQRWTAQVADSPDFKFCPKFPQQITHLRRLANAEQLTEQFYQLLSGFGDHLGPLLLQLSDNFSPKSLPNLQAYLESLDPAIKVSVEVRNKNYFSDDVARAELFNLLSDLNVGTVIADTTGRRDCVHMYLTTTDAFIRFVGNNLDPTDYKRMDDWVERIADWADKGLKSLWFFMHQNDERFVPQACVYFIKQLNKKLKNPVKIPEVIFEN